MSFFIRLERGVGQHESAGEHNTSEMMAEIWKDRARGLKRIEMRNEKRQTKKNRIEDLV